jgi:hypothetical protein
MKRNTDTETFVLLQTANCPNIQFHLAPLNAATISTLPYIQHRNTHLCGPAFEELPRAVCAVHALRATFEPGLSEANVSVLVICTSGRTAVRKQIVRIRGEFKDRKEG